MACNEYGTNGKPGFDLRLSGQTNSRIQAAAAECPAGCRALQPYPGKPRHCHGATNVFLRRRCLAGEEKRSWLHGNVWVFPDTVVKHDNPQGIQQLPLVFVNSFDLTIEDRIRVYRLSRTRYKPFRKPNFGFAFSPKKCVSKAPITGKRLKFAQLV